MKKLIYLIPIFVVTLILATFINSKTPLKISPQTEECIACHNEINPGLIKSWEEIRHSKITMEEAMKKEELCLRLESKRELV